MITSTDLEKAALESADTDGPFVRVHLCHLDPGREAQDVRQVRAPERRMSS